jgi:CubicO group peptidase (beta-lactamase class C family)
MHQFLRRPSIAWMFSALAVIGLAAETVRSGEAPAGPFAPILQPFVDKNVISGAVAFVADRDKMLDVESVGYASLSAKQPMQANDLFWIASMSKSMTATALMMLVDEGKVNIDDPVEKYLPEFKGQQVVDSNDTDHPRLPRHPITIKEILSHTSGLILASDKKLKRNGIIKDNVAQYAAIPLHCEPGTKYEYNNNGTETAGRIIEVVSGMPYADFMQRRLFDPLEMTDTTFWPSEEQAKRLAHSARLTADKKGLEEVKFDKNLTPAIIARLSKGVAVPQPIIADMGVGTISDYVNRYALPAGGIYSTAKDIGRFCQMVLNGGTDHGKRLLSEKAVSQMTSIQTGSVPVSPQEAYGLGWSIKLRDDEGPSVGSFGHRGARRTVMWVDPKNQLVMVLLIEQMDMPGEAQKHLYPAFLKAAIAKYGKEH